MLFKEPINLNLKDADIIYYPGFFTEELSTRYFSTLLKNIEWQQEICEPSKHDVLPDRLVIQLAKVLRYAP